LHDTAGVVERKVQVSAERDDLIIFGKNVGDVARYPHIGQCGAGLSAERASVDGVVDHGVREDEYIGVWICLRDLREGFVQPDLGLLREGDVGIGNGKKCQNMVAADDTVTVALRGKDFRIYVGEKIVLSEHPVQNIGVCFGLCTPFDVVIADGVYHGRFLGIENAFVDALIIVHLLVFAAVAACVDQIACHENGVDAVRLDLQKRVFKIALVAFVGVVADMDITDRGKGECDLVFIEYGGTCFGGGVVFHGNFLSAVRARCE